MIKNMKCPPTSYWITQIELLEVWGGDLFSDVVCLSLSLFADSLLAACMLTLCILTSCSWSDMTIWKFSCILRFWLNNSSLSLSTIYTCTCWSFYHTKECHLQCIKLFQVKNTKQNAVCHFREFIPFSEFTQLRE